MKEHQERLIGPIHAVDSDEAISLVGGHHLFQLLIALLLFYADSTGNRLGYTLPFMESNRISLRCFDKETHAPHEPCDYSAACESDLYDYEFTHTGLINWRVTYDHACLPDRIISLIGSCYFAGYLAGSAVFMPLSDKIGRKNIVLAGILLQACCTGVILVWEEFGLLYPYAFLLGMKMPMTSHLIFIWLSEFLTTRHRGIFTITGISFIALNNVWIALYFRYVGVWQYWYLGNSLEVVLSFFLVWLLIPESP